MADAVHGATAGSGTKQFFGTIRPSEVLRKLVGRDYRSMKSEFACFGTRQ